MAALFSNDPAKFGKLTISPAHLELMSTAICGKAENLREYIQQWAVVAAITVAKHGDTTQVIRVLDKLKAEAYRSNALRTWFCKKEVGAPFKFLKPEGDKKATIGFCREKADALTAEYEADPDKCVARLMGHQFHTMTKEADFEGFDLPKELAKLRKRASGIMADEAKKDHPSNNFGAYVDLCALLDGKPKQATAH